MSILFAALLGYDPMQQLLGPILAKLPPSHASALTGHSFLPSLISPSFQHGLDIAFDFAIACCLIAAVASLLRGGRYVYDEHIAAVEKDAEPPELAGHNETTRQVPRAKPVTRPPRMRARQRVRP